jgi:hypothetical protein
MQISKLAALGMGLPVSTFAEMMKLGPHLLAPTGSNLVRSHVRRHVRNWLMCAQNKYNSVDTVFAGFHTDLNFMTIHGKSRFPGLYIWVRRPSACWPGRPDARRSCVTAARSRCRCPTAACWCRPGSSSST